MRARLLLNLCLFALVTGLGLFLIFGGGREETPAEVALTSLAAEKITYINIARGDQDEIRFARQSGVWMMEHPYAQRANDLRIETMLNLLSAHSYAQYPAAEVSLSRFKLDQPLVTIAFNDTLVTFGDTNPLGNQRYVLVNNTVHIINDALFQQLQAPPYFFLSTRLLPEHAAISAILLPGHAIRWQGSAWTVEPGVSLGADAIVQLVNAWRETRAFSVNKYEGAGGTDRVRIEMEKQEALEFLIVSPPPQLILARADLGLQYHIGDYDAGRMFLETSPGDQNQGETATAPTP